MSYGQDAAWGLQAVRTQTDASWNGKTSTYLIASGYANNIFKGDLVYITTSGYIQNLADCAGGAGAYINQASLGVFDGCSFSVSVSQNSIDPANPGRPYWPAGQVTVGGIPAIASIITDANVVYNVQTSGAAAGAGGPGASQSNVGFFAEAVYAFVGATPIVNGNFLTGTSLLTLNLTAAPDRATPTRNFFIDALSANPQNVAGQQFNNVEVMIANHYFRVMPTIPVT